MPEPTATAITHDGQLSLIDGESDEALLLPPDKARKIYNAKIAGKLELRRNYVLDLLAFGVPVEVIEEKTHTCRRIIGQLGSQYAEQVASNGMQFARLFKSKAAKFLMLADAKADTAGFGALMVGAGIAAQRGQEAEMAAVPMGDENAGAIDVESENPALASARKFLEQKNNKIKTQNQS